MSQPHSFPPGLQTLGIDPKLVAIFLQLPSLVEQARSGSMGNGPAMHLRNMISRSRTEISLFFQTNNLSDPLTNLPPLLDPSISFPPGGIALPPGGGGGAVGSPVPNRTIPGMGIGTGIGASTPQSSSSVNPQMNIAQSLGGTGSGQLQPQQPGQAARMGMTQAQIQSSLQKLMGLTSEQRAEWFKQMPGIEPLFNRMTENMRLSKMKQVQVAAAAAKQAGQSQGVGSISGGSSSSVGGGGGTPSRTASPATLTQQHQTPQPPLQMAGNLPVSGPSTSNPAVKIEHGVGGIVDQSLPLPNLALPPGAIRAQSGTTTAATSAGMTNAKAASTPTPPSSHRGVSETMAAPTATSSRPSPSTSNPTAPRTTGPPLPSATESAPALDKDRVAYYMSLSETEARELPQLQHRQWVWVKQAVRDQQMKAAEAQRAKVQSGGKFGAPATPGVAVKNAGKPFVSTPSTSTTTATAATTTPRPQSGTSKNAPYQNLTYAQLLDMYSRTGQPITDEVRRQLNNIALDGPRATVGKKTERETAEDNIGKVLEGLNGVVGEVVPGLKGMLTDLAQTLLADALDGAARMARARQPKGKADITPQDVVTYIDNTHGIYVPGFNFEPPRPVSLRPGMSTSHGREIKMSAKRQRILQNVYQARQRKEEEADEGVDMG